MTGKQFLDMVKLMRKAQKESLKKNSTRWMMETKRLETMVDNQIEIYDRAFELARAKQLDLFDKLDTGYEHNKNQK